MPTLSTLRRAAVAGAALLALAAAGCDDPVSPRDYAGDYLLRRIDGQELPVVVSTTPWTRTVLSVLVHLEADGTGIVAHAERIEGAEDGPIEYSSQMPITWEVVDGEGFVAEIECPVDDFVCTVPPHMAGRFEASGLELDRYWDDAHDWSFDRVAIARLESLALRGR